MDKVKHYEMILNRFCGRLKLAHYRIAEAVKLPSHDLAFITVLDLNDKAFYYIDARETEQTEMVKLGRLEYNSNSIKLAQLKSVACEELLSDVPESYIESMKDNKDNSDIYAVLNNSNNYIDFVQQQLELKPCLYGLKKKRNGEVTVKYYPFSVAYQS